MFLYNFIYHDLINSKNKTKFTNMCKIILKTEFILHFMCKKPFFFLLIVNPTLFHEIDHKKQTNKQIIK